MGAGVFLPYGLESLLPLVIDGLLEPDVKVAETKSPRAAYRTANSTTASLFRHQ